jgi:hypothetical protein
MLTRTPRDNRRSLLTGNLTLIDAAARELPQVGLEDALRILVVMANRRDPRFDRAAARFAARATLEHRLGLREVRYALALLEAPPASPETVGDLLRQPLGRQRRGSPARPAPR